MTDDDDATIDPGGREPLPPATTAAEPDPPPESPRSHRGRTMAMAGLLVFALVAVAALAANHHGSRPSTGDEPAGDGSNSASAGPTLDDHWHAALGVDDCGQWVPNWLTPVSLQGVPVQAGTNNYAGLHSHGDGIIHIEPASPRDEGPNATLGRYFSYAGFAVSERSIRFVDVAEKNGAQCNGTRGVLRWAVNGKERHGNPADYKIADGDVIAVVFTTADASIPPKNAVPSYRALERMLGLVA